MTGSKLEKNLEDRLVRQHEKRLQEESRKRDQGDPNVPDPTAETPLHGPVDVRTLANEIYDLDRDVYIHTGSALGRVFNFDRDECVRTFVRSVKNNRRDIIRGETALIGNMARTISDPEIRSDFMTRYSRISEQLMHLLDGMAQDEITDPKQARLNPFNEFQKDDPLIICIGREYGSGGSQVGFGLADALHINYYDAEILTRIRDREELTESQVNEPEYVARESGKGVNPGLAYLQEGDSLKHKLRRIYSYHGLPIRDAVFFKQSEFFLDQAKKRKPFVAMGRCTDVVMLNNDIPHISIFLSAPLEQRIHHIMTLRGASYRAAKRQIRAVDRAHADYYHYFTGRRWADAGNYDICLNTAVYGVNGAIEFLLRLLENNGLTDR